MPGEWIVRSKQVHWRSEGDEMVPIVHCPELQVNGAFQNTDGHVGDISIDRLWPRVIERFAWRPARRVHAPGAPRKSPTDGS